MIQNQLVIDKLQNELKLCREQAEITKMELEQLKKTNTITVAGAKTKNI